MVLNDTNARLVGEETKHDVFRFQWTTLYLVVLTYALRLLAEKSVSTGLTSAKKPFVC